MDVAGGVAYQGERRGIDRQQQGDQDRRRGVGVAVAAGDVHRQIVDVDGEGAPGIEQAQLRTAAEAAPWLDFSPRTLDELLPRSGLTAAELSSMLLHLEIEGTVEALPGGRYCRLGKRS